MVLLRAIYLLLQISPPEVSSHDIFATEIFAEDISAQETLPHVLLTTEIFAALSFTAWRFHHIICNFAAGILKYFAALNFARGNFSPFENTCSCIFVQLPKQLMAE